MTEGCETPSLLRHHHSMSFFLQLQQIHPALCCQEEVWHHWKVFPRRRDNTAAKLVADLSIELSGTSTEEEIWVARSKCSICQIVKLASGISPATHLASLTSPSIIGITEVVMCFSLNACAFDRLNFLNASSENCDGDREGRGCISN
jgi:hypothetical protein